MGGKITVNLKELH